MAIIKRVETDEKSALVTFDPGKFFEHEGQLYICLFCGSGVYSVLNIETDVVGSLNNNTMVFQAELLSVSYQRQ